jgi:hypothetical protein
MAPRSARKTKRMSPRDEHTGTSTPREFAPDVELRRKRFMDLVAASKMTMTDLARESGMKSANALFNFINGHSHSLSQATLERLMKVIPGATMATLMGLETPDDIGPPVRPLQVRAIAQAGLMQSGFDLPASRQYQVPLPLEREMHAAGVFGVEVREPGAEKLFTPGTVLVCLPLSAWDGELANGRKLILQRVVDNKVEVSVRELELQANEAWLWLRSTHPEHQAPIAMPYVPGKPLRPWRSGQERLSIAAVAVAAYMPLK